MGTNLDHIPEPTPAQPEAVTATTINAGTLHPSGRSISVHHGAFRDGIFVAYGLSGYGVYAWRKGVLRWA